MGDRITVEVQSEIGRLEAVILHRPGPEVANMTPATAQRAIRRGTFRKVKELIARIEDFVRHYNVDCQPFAWVATADSILQKVNRLCQYISGTRH